MARLSLALPSLALLVFVAANCTQEPDDLEPGTGGRIVLPEGGAAGAGGDPTPAGQGGAGNEPGGESQGGNEQGGAGEGGNTTAGIGGDAGAGQGGGTSCQDDHPALDVALDTFNVALAGNFVPNEKARRQPLINALAQYDSDIVCLQEVWEQSDKELIADAVKAKFPHTFSVKHDINTVVDDATGLDGKIPTLPSTPPCNDTDAPGSVAKFDAAVDCLRDNCPIDASLGEKSETISSACATSKCAAKALALLSASKRCYGCLLPQMPSETFENMRNECKTNPKAGLAFGGQNGVMILSKYPLTDTSAVVLPGTWNRRVVLRAKAQLPNGSQLQVYCHHLTPIFTGSLYPYTGLYGDGADKNGWVNEQHLHAKKMVELAKKDAPCTPTVFMADTNASREDLSAKPPIHAEGVATLDELETLFTRGVATNYTPACTYCKDNENVDDNDAGADQWLDYIYLFNIDPSKIKSTKRTFVDPIVSVSQGGGGAGGATTTKVELSDHYGLRTVVTLGK